MRVLQVMASGLHGGAELFYEDLVPALGRNGIDQVCVIRPYPTRAAKLEAEGARVAMLRFGGPLDLVTPWRLARIAREEHPDIVMGWMNRACRILPKGAWLNVGRLGGYYDLKYYARCRHLICNTPDICHHVVRHGWPPDRVHHIPNFCSIGQDAAVDRAVLDTDVGAPVLLVLARLQPAKGIDVALRALPQIEGAVLWIAGDGPEEAALKSLAKDLGIAERVRFLGWRDDRTALLKAADICLVPSRHEPFGNVVVAAWAHHVPLIAASSQGPAYLVRPGDDGLLVPVDDPAALAQAATALIADAALRRRLIEGGRRRSQQEFSEAAVVSRYEQVFRKIAAEGPGTAARL